MGKYIIFFRSNTVVMAADKCHNFCQYLIFPQAADKSDPCGGFAAGPLLEAAGGVSIPLLLGGSLPID